IPGGGGIEVALRHTLNRRRTTGEGAARWRGGGRERQRHRRRQRQRRRQQPERQFAPGGAQCTQASPWAVPRSRPLRGGPPDRAGAAAAAAGGAGARGAAPAAAAARSDRGAPPAIRR
ncbi:MAG: hypothetical protein ACK55I_18115, partial [bacterium]